MSTAAPRPGGPSAGLPEGVYLAPLGRRLVAYLIDAMAPYWLIIGGSILLATGGPGWLAVILFLLPVAWALMLWWMYAVKAAGPGMKLMKLQLVGLSDGRPIGFVRALLRAVILTLLSGTGIVLIVMAVLMLQQSRRQGWHDIAVESVVIDERPLAPPLPGQPTTVRELMIKLLSAKPQPETKPEPAALTTGPATEPQAPEPATRPEPVESQQPAPAAPEPAASEPAAPEPAAPEPVAPQRVTISEEPEPEQPQPASPTEPAPVPAVEETPAEPSVPLPPNQGWVAVLDDGQEIPINRLTLFGRNPQPRAGEEDAQLIKVVDSERTVSKTHLALTVDSRGVLVIDRGSTNGSAVTDPFGVYQLLPAEQPTRLGAEGYVVSFGKHQLRIARSGS